MKFITAAAAAFALCLAMPGMTSTAWAETRTIAAPGLHAIEASGPFRMQIVAGSGSHVVIEGSNAHLARVEARYSNGVLRLDGHCNFGCDFEDLDVTVRVTTQRLDRLDVSKGAQVQAAGLQSEDLRLAVRMGAILEIAGSCGRLNADVSMGGQLAAGALSCREVSIDAGMGGSARINASESVDAGATMGGQIEVSGAPAGRREREFMGGIVSVQ